MRWRIVYENMQKKPIKTDIYPSSKTALSDWAGIRMATSEAKAHGRASLIQHDGSVVNSVLISDLPVVNQDQY